MFEKLKSRAARQEERGASAVEYGLLIAGIAGVVVLVIFALGPIIRDVFDKTCDDIASHDGNAATGNCATS